MYFAQRPIYEHSVSGVGNLTLHIKKYSGVGNLTSHIKKHRVLHINCF